MRTLRLSGPLIALSLILVLGSASSAGSSLSVAVAPADAERVGPDRAPLLPGAGSMPGSDSSARSQLHLPLLLAGTPSSDGNLPLSPSYIVYTDGTTIYAFNGATRKIDFQGPDAATVIRATLAEGRRIVINAGKYVITSPIELVSHLTLDMEPGTVLEVPNGYDRYVFGLAGAGPPQFGVHHTHIQGGTIQEERSDRYTRPHTLLPQRKWVAILLYVQQNGHGVFFNTVRDVDIWDPGTAIKFLAQMPCVNTCWINGNGFYAMHIGDPLIFIDFAKDAAVPEDQAQFFYNYFEDIMGSVGQAETTFGVKDVRGHGNMFVNVNFWDIHHSVNAISARILPYAKETLILGGLMTYWNFVDNGIRTQVIDRSFDRQIFVDELTIGHPPTTPGYRIYAQEDGLYLEYVNTHIFYRFVLEEVDSAR